MAARTDRTTDPAILADLLLARRGTAYFLRKLKELPDDALGEPSLLPGWSRAHVVAHVGYNARALSRLVTWAATGVETPMYTSPAVRAHEIEFGATLTPNALRNLAEHSAVHLNVEWRDLAPDAWAATVRTAQGREVPAAETAWMRAREVWLHAVDLDNGGRFEDLPADFLGRLLADVTAAWARRMDAAPTLARLAAWATGRSGDAAGFAAAPRWL